jgi:hypothetical protein
MWNRSLVSTLTLAALAALSSAALAQTAAGVAKTQPGAHVDLSGDWGYGIGVNYLPQGGNAQVGPPDDKVPYQPWAREKFLSERPMTGPRATFDNTTDPHMKYCDPLGTPRIWTWPSKFNFFQTPEAVYVIYEYDLNWRGVVEPRSSPGPGPVMVGRFGRPL